MSDSAARKWRDVLKIHPACELFLLSPPDELKVLGEDIKKNGLQQRAKVIGTPKPKRTPGPMTISVDPAHFDYELLDGRNRLDAMVAVGVQVDVFDKKGWLNAKLFDVVIAGDIDPVEYVISANLHRRHLTNDQRRDLIGKLLKADPTKSNRQIAELAKSTHPTVAAQRAKLKATGDVEKLSTSVDTKGREQSLHRPARQQQSPPSPDKRAVREAGHSSVPTTLDRAKTPSAPASVSPEPAPAPKSSTHAPAQPDMFKDTNVSDTGAKAQVEPRIEYARKAIVGLKSLSTAPDVTALLIEAFIEELGSRDIINLPSDAKARLLRFCEETLARFSDETLAIASDLPIDLERSRKLGAESAAAGLEALLAPWIELKHRYAERRAAIKAAVRKETGVSDEDDVKYVAESLARAFSGGGESSPDAQRYFALRSQIEKRFPEIEDYEWQRVDAPLEVVIDHITSSRPETFVELGIHARAIHYRFWDSDFSPSEEDCAKVRQFLADAMRLAGLPGPMVASSNLDAETVAFAKLFTDRLEAKIEKHDHDWFESKKDGQLRGSLPSWEKGNKRKWAEEVLREAKSGLPRLIGPKTP